MPFMEGALWKWTNYMSGWQLRWFVLDVGVLSYYKSQDEINLGSRGSVKMACCDVSTQVNDPLRIDLKIPPDQHIYVRASTPGERQQWLVALGTAKACLTQGNSTVQKAKQQEYKDPKKLLHERMSEVHVCKDILLGQIENIKKICTTTEATHEFQEAATLLSATCDTFLNNIKDCVAIAEQNWDSSSPNSSRVSTPVKHENQVNNVRSPMMPSSPSFHPSPKSPSPSQSRQKSPTPVLNISNENDARPELILQKSSPSEQTISPPTEKQPKRAPTVFTICPHRFIDVGIDEQGNIPTKQFLLACNSILPIFDVLGPTAFAPVKLDISGNIKKLTAKYDTNPNSFTTIQLMIISEIQTDSCTVKNSATDALLWLKRALQFTNAFLEEVDKGERELVVVASTAYSKTLRKYHGWVVRGVFAMAVKAVPYWKDFAKALGTTDAGIASESDVLLDIKDFTNTLANIINKINEFYAVHKLDSDNTV